MARKRRGDDAEGGDVHANGTAVLDPPAPEQQSGESSPTPAVAEKNRPAASFAASSDRTTRLEVAVWARVVKVSDTEEYTQYSLTVSRSWRDKDGNWTGNTFYRVHDVPVLLYLMQQAYNWCVAQRAEVRIATDGDVPF